MVIVGSGGNGGGGGANSTRNNSAGGGGAAGYSGNGGSGSSDSGTGSAGQGGGGGGGGRAGSAVGGSGGGVGIYGEGTSGAGGAQSNNYNAGGKGGSGGTDGDQTNSGVFGGGGGSSDDTNDWPGGAGGGGAVRIIWGDGRSFPISKTGDETPVVPPETTTIQPTDLFLVNDGANSYSVQAQNFASYPTYSVLVQRTDGLGGAQSYKCPAENIKSRVTDEDWMLVQRGTNSYKVNATVVAVEWAPADAGNFEYVNKPVSDPYNFALNAINTLASGASSSRSFDINGQPPVPNYDYGWFIARSGGSVFDNYRQRKNTTGTFDYEYNSVLVSTVAVDDFELGLFRTDSKIPVAEANQSCQVSFATQYPPGQYLATSGRNYAENLWFCLMGMVDLNTWSDNEVPEFTVQGKRSTVTCDCGESQSMGIIVAPTAVDGVELTDILCNNPDAIAGTSETTFGNRTSPNQAALCFETVKGFNGEIMFDTPSDYTWVVTQKINYVDTSLRVIPLTSTSLAASSLQVNIPVAENIAAGNTVIFVAGSRQDRIDNQGSYSMEDTKGNTWQKIISGTQGNGLTDVMIFRSSLTSDLQVGDNVQLSVNATGQTNLVFSAMYVISNSNVSVVDTNDFQGSGTTRTPRITGGKLVINVFGTGASNTSNVISNPGDWAPVEIMDSRVSGNSAWTCYAENLPDSLFQSSIEMTVSANYSGVAGVADDI